ncbi:hypothetical protein LINPERHAP1_LOCUS22532, partial [Linum perenne]
MKRGKGRKALRECFFESLVSVMWRSFYLVLVLLCLVVWQGKKKKNSSRREGCFFVLSS